MREKVSLPVLRISLLICLAFVACTRKSVQPISNGIIVYPSASRDSGASAVRLQVISEKIIRVSAVSGTEFPETNSLMIVDSLAGSPDWNWSQNDSLVSLSTDALTAKVSLKSGRVIFMDRSGKVLLSEAPQSRAFSALDNYDSLYSIKQIFLSDTTEAFYGLGQHQNGIMNYQGEQVDLTQYNGVAVVPYVVSSKNYGILWDNYSRTLFGDAREYQMLSGFKLYNAQEKVGGLTANYQNKETHETIVSRNESEIDYSFLASLKKFPETLDPAKGLVTWQGFMETEKDGIHKFLLKMGGYVKIWINGNLMVDRWKICWNPGTVRFDVSLSAGKRVPVKIEWIPDGGESFLSLKYLEPLSKSLLGHTTFLSEAGKQIDYYLVAGNNMDELVGGYRYLTGKAPVMPKWAMGLWQSRERYKSQNDLMDVVREFREKEIPLDNIVLDWFYWEEDKWGSQEFDPARFPDPDGMIDSLHTIYNTHFMISVWPKFYEGINTYQQFNDKSWLYTRNIENGQKDWIGYVSTFYDAFNPVARKAFWELMDKNLYSKGVDAWWLDATEPDILSNATLQKRKNLMDPTALGPATEYFNAYSVVNAKGVYKGQLSKNPDNRVFILTRSAYAGLQRYSTAVWSGDISATWQDLGDQISGGMNFSLSGLPYWTTDIGGFAVESRYQDAKGEDLREWRELMTRWYQFGAFCPLFRVHGQYPFREIFNVAPENHPAYVSMLYYDKLRYRMLPYIYSLNGKIYQDDYTMMRALIMDFPQDRKVFDIDDQYLFGPSVMVCPVYDYGSRSRKVYLPSGNNWYNFHTGKYLPGGTSINADAPYQHIPLFVRDGAIIPFGPDLQYTAEKKPDPITLWVFTGKDGNFTLYGDDGNSRDYLKGEFSEIPMQYNEESHTLVLGERQGSFSGMLHQRTFRIIWVSPEKEMAYSADAKADETIHYTGNRVEIKHEF